jgi:hypothetical protein
LYEDPEFIEGVNNHLAINKNIYKIKAMSPERKLKLMERYTHHSYHGPIKHDFLGESHLIDGKWVRQSFPLSDKEKQVYIFSGKQKRYPELIKQSQDWWGEIPQEKKVKPGDKLIYKVGGEIKNLETGINMFLKTVHIIAIPSTVDEVEKQEGAITSISVTEYRYTDKFKETWEHLPQYVKEDVTLLKPALESGGCVRREEVTIPASDFRLASSYEKEFAKRYHIDILNRPQETFNV